jgi:hypothetical protein
MTGQIAFARTLRALDADDFRGSNLGLLLALAIFALWTWWLFAARIPQYETSPNTQLDLPAKSATADFPPTSNIHPGQPAQIIPTGGIAIPAKVENVRNEPNGQILVKFNLLPPPSQSPAAGPQPAQASIEVARLSPARVLLRSLR